jgi:hypothetical protein
VKENEYSLTGKVNTLYASVHGSFAGEREWVFLPIKSSCGITRHSY